MQEDDGGALPDVLERVTKALHQEGLGLLSLGAPQLAKMAEQPDARLAQALDSLS